MSTAQIEEFKTRLKNNDFADVTGARKSIGRNTAWNEKTKELARQAADEHFSKSSGTPAAKKPTPKSAAKKPTGKKTAQQTAPVETAVSAPKGKGGKRTRSEEIAEAINGSNEVVRNVQENLTALQAAKALGASHEDVAATANKAQVLLSHCIDTLLNHITKTEEQTPPAAPVVSSPPVIPPAMGGTNMNALAHAAAIGNGQVPGASPFPPPSFGPPQPTVS